MTGVYLRFVDEDGREHVAGFASAADALLWSQAWDGETQTVVGQPALGEVVAPPEVEGAEHVEAAAGVEVDEVRECGCCGWRQTGGRGETVLSCPDCGARGWRRVQ